MRSAKAAFLATAAFTAPPCSPCAATRTRRRSRRASPPPKRWSSISPTWALPPARLESCGFERETCPAPRRLSPRPRTWAPRPSRERAAPPRPRRRRGGWAVDRRRGPRRGQQSVAARAAAAGRGRSRARAGANGRRRARRGRPRRDRPVVRMRGVAGRECQRARADRARSRQGGVGRRHFRRAARLWLEASAPYEAARARLELARALLLAGKRDDAAAELAAVERTFAGSGHVGRRPGRAAGGCAPLTAAGR